MYILVAALFEEVSDLAQSEKDNLVISGMGKLNTLHALMKEFQMRGPLIKAVINLGTAGSQKISPGSLVEVAKSYQRDTAFFSEAIDLNPRTDLLAVRCGSGDRIESIAEKDPWEIVDMELYAIARFCKENAIPLVSIKYVTDRNDVSVYKEWKKQLPIASQALSQFWNLHKSHILSEIYPG
jgi:adenosylhomocysteine nucleosidase